MDAIVLAGGYATRLWPLTRRRPNMFLPIDGTTVIDWVFEELEADTRIQDVYVSTNAAFAVEFESYLIRPSVRETHALDRRDDSRKRETRRRRCARSIGRTRRTLQGHADHRR